MNESERTLVIEILELAGMLDKERQMYLLGYLKGMADSVNG